VRSAHRTIGDLDESRRHGDAGQGWVGGSPASADIPWPRQAHDMRSAIMNSPKIAPAEIVGIGGSMRSGSSTELTLRAVLSAAAARGAAVSLFAGKDLQLPPYEPGVVDQRSRRLLDTVASADAVVLGSPGYHGTISGLVKNAIDYLEELRSGERCYLDGVPIGCIATANGWQAAVNTLGTLRVLAHSLRGWPTPLGIALNMSGTPVFGPDGGLVSPEVRESVEIMADQLLAFASRRGTADLDTARARELVSGCNAPGSRTGTW
jgi:FMN reductase